MRLEQRLLELPPGADVVSFVLSNGKVPDKPQLTEVLILEALFKQYRENLPYGAMEESSLATVILHMGHFERLLGLRFPVQSLKFEHLQGYVQKRSRDRFRGKTIRSYGHEVGDLGEGRP